MSITYFCFIGKKAYGDYEIGKVFTEISRCISLSLCYFNSFKMEGINQNEYTC